MKKYYKYIGGLLLLSAGVLGITKGTIHQTIAQQLLEDIKELNALQDASDFLLCDEMNELEILTEDLANQLIQSYRGNKLCLENIVTISPTVAKILTHFHGSVISLPNLIVNDDETIQYLAQYKGKLIVPNDIARAIKKYREQKFV